MIIKQDSWHFKLLREWSYKITWEIKEGYPVSYCRYFWSVVLCFPKIIGFGIALASIAALCFMLFLFTVVYPINYLIIGLFDVVLLEDLDYFGLTGLIGTCIILLIGSIGKAWDGDIKVWPEYIKLPNSKPKSTIKKPSLLKSYIKAKKAKMCPLVTLE